MFRPIPGCVVLYPCDARVGGGLRRSRGRPRGHVLHPDLPSGDADDLSAGREVPDRRLARSCGSRAADAVTVVAAGRHRPRGPQGLRRAREGRHRACGSSTPIPSSPWTRTASARRPRATGGKVVVVEDHYAGRRARRGRGRRPGRAASWSSTCACASCPGPGKPDELLEQVRDLRPHIVRAVKELLPAVEDAPSAVGIAVAAVGLAAALAAARIRPVAAVAGLSVSRVR